MSEFKVGDRVVITDKSLQTYGWQGIVNEVDSMESAGNICIDFADSFGYYNANEIAHFAAAHPPAAATGARGDVSRDTVLRNDLYGSVQEVLDRHHTPLGEKFLKYRNLADKQIQERDATIAALREKLAAAQAAASAWKQAAKTHRKFGAQMAQRVEDAEQGWHDEVTSGYE